jgi:acyl-coenzyme A thioesterase 1/2/4
MLKRVTIFEPPPLDNSKAAIENVLDLTPISDIGPVRSSLSALEHKRSWEYL